MFMGLQPVSLSYIPREGEYDVICHHCSSSVDSLHQSVSERNDDSPKSVASHSKSCPGAFLTPVANAGPPDVTSKCPYDIHYPALGQPPFHTTIQSPFGGIYMFNMPSMTPNMTPGSAALQKPIIPRSRSPSVSDPSPEQSPDSLEASARLKSSLQEASLVDAVVRSQPPTASLETKENKHPIRPPTPAEIPEVQSDIEHIAVAGAIAASLCGKSVNESLASTRSLTAAVERLRQVIGTKKLSRGPSLHKSIKSGTTFKSQSKASSAHRAHTAASCRRAKVPRHRRRAKKNNKPKPKSAAGVAENKPEQVNSATQRRDRREKMARGRKEAQPNGQYWHMMMIPNWRSNVPHR